MDYEGLTTDDLLNVGALNRAWLGAQRAVPGSRLTAGQLERLAAAPFLLFSFREQDEHWWQSLLGEGRQQGLLDPRPPVTGEILALQSAGLAFLWDLARRNPYVARIVSGASLHWCEQIASATLVQVQTCATSAHMIEPRFDNTSSLHRRLLRRGSSASNETRIFAQIGALQAMLTNTDTLPARPLSAAACRMPRPAQRTADKV
jgi:hypothetical protein